MLVITGKGSSQQKYYFSADIANLSNTKVRKPIARLMPPFLLLKLPKLLVLSRFSQARWSLHHSTTFTLNSLIEHKFIKNCLLKKRDRPPPLDVII